MPYAINVGRVHVVLEALGAAKAHCLEAEQSAEAFLTAAAVSVPALGNANPQELPRFAPLRDQAHLVAPAGVRSIVDYLERIAREQRISERTGPVREDPRRVWVDHHLVWSRIGDQPSAVFGLKQHQARGQRRPVGIP